jgi:hypothetical protein
MSPFVSEFQPFTTQGASRPETSKLSEEEIKKITSLWRERLTSLPEIIQKTLKAALDKIEKALEYTDPETKENVLKNGLYFLTIFGLYLSSPSFQTSPPRKMEKLIEDLNNFCPEPLFLKSGNTFTTSDLLGNTRIYRITQIVPPGELSLNFKNEDYVSGTNMWDFPEGNKFIPGNYFLKIS